MNLSAASIPHATVRQTSAPVDATSPVTPAHLDAHGRELARHSARVAAARVALTVGSDLIALATSMVVFAGAGEAGALFTVMALAVLAAGGSYRFRITPSVWSEAGGILGRLAVPAIVISYLFVGTPASGAILWGFPWAAGALLAGRAAVYALTRLIRSRRKGGQPVIVIGAGRLGLQAAHTMLDHPRYGLHPIGLVDNVADTDLDVPLLGRLADLPAVVSATGATGVVAAFGAARDEEMLRVLRVCEELDVRVWVLPRLFELGAWNDGPNTSEVQGFPLVELDGYRRALRNRRAKRALDLAITIPAALMAAPLMAGLALLVRLSSPGPVLFRQNRVGERGKVVELMKFRSMAVNNDSDTKWSTNGDARVTTIGKILRATSLDELPQLWNVIRGDMSLVGPRPERPVFVDKFSVVVPGYEARHRLAPGLTGLAQINGLRGDTSIEDRSRLDNRYIDRWSLWQDVMILARTVPAVMRDAATALRSARG